MDRRIAVITPAFRAERWIGEAVRSVLAQSVTDWELWVISDDGVDYEALLGADGLADPRLRFLSTGSIGAGASRARNLALDRIYTPYAAILDADDRLKPDKLQRALAALEEHPIVASALDVMDDGYRRLRLVGDGSRRDDLAGRGVRDRHVGGAVDKLAADEHLELGGVDPVFVPSLGDGDLG